MDATSKESRLSRLLLAHISKNGGHSLNWQIAHVERCHQHWLLYHILEQPMLPSRLCLFRCCIFQQGNVQPHTACITAAWLCSRRVWGLKWPLCSPGLSLTEKIWHIMKWKIQQLIVEQLESCIRPEWDSIPLPKVQRLISSVTKHWMYGLSL